jgi:acyl-CoA thioesterase I
MQRKQSRSTAGVTRRDVIVRTLSSTAAVAALAAARPTSAAQTVPTVPATSDPAELVTPLLKSTSPVTWLFAGDSITQGAVHTRGWRDYTQLFKERLGELSRNEDVVINTAVGGWTLDAFVDRFDERVSRFRPDALLLMFGTNDSGAGGGIERFVANYEKVLAVARERGLRTIVQTALPLFPADADRYAAAAYVDPAVRPGKVQRLKARQANISDFATAATRVAELAGVPAIDHWAAWQRVAPTLGQLTDGALHPNEYGHRLIARTIYDAMGIADESSWMCRLFLPVNVTMG